MASEEADYWYVPHADEFEETFTYVWPTPEEAAQYREMLKYRRSAHLIADLKAYDRIQAIESRLGDYRKAREVWLLLSQEAWLDSREQVLQAAIDYVVRLDDATAFTTSDIRVLDLLFGLTQIEYGPAPLYSQMGSFQQFARLARLHCITKCQERL